MTFPRISSKVTPCLWTFSWPQWPRTEWLVCRFTWDDIVQILILLFRIHRGLALVGRVWMRGFPSKRQLFSWLLLRCTTGIYKTSICYDPTTDKEKLVLLVLRVPIPSFAIFSSLIYFIIVLILLSGIRNQCRLCNSLIPCTLWRVACRTDLPSFKISLAWASGFVLIVTVLVEWIFWKLYISSKRTTNRVLDNLASSHEDIVSEMKRKAEVVMAATTRKQAGALARTENSGGFSFFSDNVGKVVKYGTFRFVFNKNSGVTSPAPRSLQAGRSFPSVYPHFSGWQQGWDNRPEVF